MIWILSILLILLHIPFLYQFPKARKLKDIEYDTCIVLGSPTQADGSISRIQRSRVDKAIELYRTKKTKSIVFSGGNVCNAYIEADCMAQYAIMQQVDSKHIYIEPNARNTYENLLFSNEICKQHGFHQVIVVTSRFHLRRADFFTRKLFLNYAIVSSNEKEKWKHYLSEYFRMWNTLRIEFILYLKR